MAFCKFSGDLIIDRYTLLDNMFVNEYLPLAPDNAVRVYVYGLYMASLPQSGDNTIDSMSSALNMPQDAIRDAFKYWDEQGLVELSADFKEIKYLPVKANFIAPKKYNPEKYADFNKQLQSMYPDRMITPNEFNEYYGVMESAHIQPEAMLMIIRYCLGLKGTDIRYNYVLTVARDWAKNGIRTYEDVEAKISEQEENSENIQRISHELGLATRGGLEERELYTKWTKSWSYDLSAVLFAARQCNHKGGYKKLDTLLDKYYRLGIFTSQDMDNYKKNREKMYTLASNVNKTIGVYYESLDYIVEHYITSWLDKGFDDNAILTIAKYCFVARVRTLDGVNGTIQRFYKMGLVSEGAINQYLDTLIANDTAISSILEKTGSLRSVTAQDREYYNTWTSVWGFGADMIDYVCTLAVGRAQPISYINRILATYKNQNISSVSDAKARGNIDAVSTTKSQDNTLKHDYTREELKAFFSDSENFDNIEV